MVVIAEDKLGDSKSESITIMSKSGDADVDSDAGARLAFCFFAGQSKVGLDNFLLSVT